MIGCAGVPRMGGNPGSLTLDALPPGSRLSPCMINGHLQRVSWGLLHCLPRWAFPPARDGQVNRAYPIPAAQGLAPWPRLGRSGSSTKPVEGP